MTRVVRILLAKNCCFCPTLIILNQYISHISALCFSQLIQSHCLSFCLFAAALLNTRQAHLAPARSLLEDRRHGALVHLLTPHADDGRVHLSRCSLAVLVVLQLQTGALQPRQLALRGHETSPEHCAALRDTQETHLARLGSFETLCSRQKGRLVLNH